MIRINLLGDALAQAAARKPEKEAAQVYQGEGTGKVSLPIAGIVAGLIFPVAIGIYGLYLYLQVGTLQAENVKLEEEKKALEPYTKKAEEYQQKKDALEKRKKVMEDLQLQQHLPVNFLARLADSLPDDVWFSRVRQEGTGDKIRIIIDGESSSFEAINTFRNNLANDKVWFADVQFPSDRAAEKKGNVITFTLTLQLKNASKLPGKTPA